MTRASFEAQSGPKGAYLIGGPEEVARKILRHSDDLGGISRVTSQMDSAELASGRYPPATSITARTCGRPLPVKFSKRLALWPTSAMLYSPLPTFMTQKS